jgi:hypothetical protein
MKHDPQLDSIPDVRWSHDDFEIAASLREATEATEAPPHLYRRVPWRQSAGLLGGACALLLVGTWAFLRFFYPPELVREALVHEHREATLRGDFQPDKPPMLSALGLRGTSAVPGLLQLQRPCEIDGQVAYHVTTFFEHGGGMVTILAFDKPVPDLRAGDQGNWLGRHWRVADGLPGKTVLILADNRRVLIKTERLLRSG